MSHFSFSVEKPPKIIMPGRGSLTENSAPTPRVPVVNAGLTSVSDTENPDGSGTKNSAIVNPEPLQTDGKTLH